MFEPCEDPKEERMRLLEAVKATFSDLLGEEKGVYLQTKSDKWDGQTWLIAFATALLCFYSYSRRLHLIQR